MTNNESKPTNTTTDETQKLEELTLITRGQEIGCIISLALAIILTVISRITQGVDANYHGYFLIVMAYGAGFFLYRSIKRKKKRDIILAVLWTLLALYDAGMVAWYLFH